MGKQEYDRIKRILSILLAIFFIITLTVASASAAESSVNNGNECKNGVCTVGGCHDGLCSFRPAGAFTVGVASTIVNGGGSE